MSQLKGKINSIQTLGTLDGPGVRFVVFLQGCNLRCGCCHNPETWADGEKIMLTAEELVNRAENYKSYFGKEGGITLSGGEPLLQAEFVTEVFSLCKEKGINTCLDTSGSLLNPKINKLLELCDTVLLDIKYTTDEDYKNFVGCSINAPLRFLELLNKKNIPTIIRQVIIPTVNDNEQNIQRLNEIVKNHPNIIKVELLPFKKLCTSKYEQLGLEFRFGNLPTPTREEMEYLNSRLNKINIINL